MTTPPTSARRIRGSARRTVSTAVEDLVETEPLRPGRTLPLLVAPKTAGVDLADLVAGNRPWFDRLLAAHGCLIFRDFQLGVEDFERFMRAAGDGELLTDPTRYDLNGPKEQVYITTKYPPQHEIFLHNETWFQYTWAAKIYFCCQTAPTDGGATTVADCRGVLDRLDPALVARFDDGLLQVRNYGPRIGLRRWQDVFGTEERAEVERFCIENEIEWAWLDGDRLHTRYVRPALLDHPVTGERLWFNHLAHGHISTNTTAAMAASVERLDLHEVPMNTYYADGSEIATEDIETIRAAYRAEIVAYPWKPGNVMVLDNMLAAHGRASFTGERKVLAGMTELLGWNSLR